MDFNVQLEGFKNVDVEFNEFGDFGADLGLGSVIAIGGSDHAKLKNRDADNQHPISAITNLKSTLDNRPSEALTNQDIESLLSAFV